MFFQTGCEFELSNTNIKHKISNLVETSLHQSLNKVFINNKHISQSQNSLTTFDYSHLKSKTTLQNSSSNNFIKDLFSSQVEDVKNDIVERSPVVQNTKFYNEISKISKQIKQIQLNKIIIQNKFFSQLQHLQAQLEKVNKNSKVVNQKIKGMKQVLKDNLIQLRIVKSILQLQHKTFVRCDYVLMAESSGIGESDFEGYSDQRQEYDKLYNNQLDKVERRKIKNIKARDKNLSYGKLFVPKIQKLSK